ncbi:MAG TPA: iron-sulfur cluster assembly accessory protein, partial [Flavihumibacter sp.]|nr:iron-sulfur cluster assembly accessory protein [Flavihumibacter sp.]
MIYISDKASERVNKLIKEVDADGDKGYFVRVSVVGGGCSGLSYKIDFDNASKPTDQVFENNGIKIVT